MNTLRTGEKAKVLQQYDSRDQSSCGTVVEEDLPGNASPSRSFWLTASTLIGLENRETQIDGSSISLAEFVERKFIPEYVATRRSAGRAHFRAILKHVLTPEEVSRAFAETREKTNVKLTQINGWPYMNSLSLGEVSGERIQHLTSTALKSGYSIQTATHIRNVIRAIFSHAISSGCYNGKNPAEQVTLPAMARKKAHTLTLAELKQVLHVMRYPEKHIALFAILTEMNVTEICGLQWKYVNLSNEGHPVDEDWIPPKNIAVRNQWYRGEFGFVVANRKRFVPVPELLCSMLRELKHRKRFTGPEDFVLASRGGTPIYPENIAARRLKSIGRAFEMPWLSWYVFHRTHLNLRSEFGRHLHKEYEKVLSPQALLAR